MKRPYKAHICETIGELNELLGWMMLPAPSFQDRTGYFVDHTIDTEFEALNASFDMLCGNPAAPREADRP